MKYKFIKIHIVIVLILLVFVVLSIDYAEITFPIAAFILTIFYFLISKTSCPKCHKLRGKKEVGKETIDCHSKYSERDFDTSGATFCVRKTKFKCKFCNHEWDEEKLVSRH